MPFNNFIFVFTTRPGTHLTHEIVSMLMKQNAEPTTGFPPHVSWHDMTYLDNLTSPRKLLAHVHFHHLPTQMKDKRCKIIYVARNAKDVAVSGYYIHKQIKKFEYEGSWDHYLSLFLDGKGMYIYMFEHVS
jgi:hypothetical protein